MKKRLDPVHPGEVLKEEFMAPLGLSANKLARAIRVPPNRVSAIVNGERSVTADTALRLAKAFGTTPEFWLNLQRQHDLDRARDEATDLARIAPIRAAG
jgi:addiction module HigA family antidote